MLGCQTVLTIPTLAAAARWCRRWLYDCGPLPFL